MKMNSQKNINNPAPGARGTQRPDPGLTETTHELKRRIYAKLLKKTRQRAFASGIVGHDF